MRSRVENFIQNQFRELHPTLFTLFYMSGLLAAIYLTGESTIIKWVVQGISSVVFSDPYRVSTSFWSAVWVLLMLFSFAAIGFRRLDPYKAFLKGWPVGIFVVFQVAYVIANQYPLSLVATIVGGYIAITLVQILAVALAQKEIQLEQLVRANQEEKQANAGELEAIRNKLNETTRLLEECQGQINGTDAN